MVGAVLVRGDRRLASGYHRRLGAPHAEAVALRRAGSEARDATLYVTLEPCAHEGRTPPCIDAVLAAGVARVVVGLRDPDPRTAGRSIARLRRARVEVVVGVEGDACRELNRGFLARVERGRPFTHLKLAASLDGRIATAAGESRWISGLSARRFVHRLRRRADAIAIGSGTQRADDPELSARSGERVVHRPVRIVVDSRLRTPPGARLIAAGPRGTAWLLTTRAAPAVRRRRLEAAGARVIDARSRGGRVDLRDAWRRLGALGVNELLVEGGGALGAALLRAGVVDRLSLILAPILIGGDGRSVLGPLGVRQLSRAPAARRLALRRLGPDVLLCAEW